ncbi:TPA: HlyD family secretion protein, partial [Neisseria meningitidis]
SVACSSWQSFLQERSYATAYWPFSVRESCTSNANPPPSKAVGFIKPKDKVVLRYQAYPYQKFGHATGEIISVARTALGKQELSGLGIIFTNPTLLNEPAYLVKVKLEKQTIKAYGENKPLQIGMILEADILHERKKLYEWVLDPLYSISGKIN